ncbi:phosphonate C-P lyase system protein PhnG [Escherichia coli]|uniref:phosphonate C-P lyase system protein PhnG n=1 Tax=Escherichia coli TaxID=562 RepID=UPI00248559D8|nr:phosphonate C-P lyase system protein PhnG [Escherichia coli]
MHADTATRQHWMSVLAHSQPAELAARLNALNITADYEVIRTAETGLVQIQARMGGTGERFFAGDATLTRAAVRLTDGTLGYSWVLGRDKQHAERCALIDALMQQLWGSDQFWAEFVQPGRTCKPCVARGVVI